MLLGITAWRNPNSPLVKRWVGSSQLNRTKFLGPLIGVVFILTGAFFMTAQVECRSYFQIPGLMDLRWTWWPGVWPAIGVATLIGILNARKRALIVGVPQALLTVCFGVASGEAAGFHVGVYAGRWFAISMVCVGLSVVVEVAASRFLMPAEQSNPTFAADE